MSFYNKVLAYVFWDREEAVHVELLPRNTTMNANGYYTCDIAARTA
jgi:hypothetical protein